MNRFKGVEGGSTPAFRSLASFFAMVLMWQPNRSAICASINSSCHAFARRATLPRHNRESSLPPVPGP